MRGRRGEVFVIGAERMLDEEELGLESAADAEPEPELTVEPWPAIEEELGADRVDEADESMRVVSREHKRSRVPMDLGRWLGRGGAIAATLIVAVLVVSALVRGGGEERGSAVAAQPPSELAPADEHVREPKAPFERERFRQDTPSARSRVEREPRRAKDLRASDEDGQPSSAAEATAAPASDAAPAEPVAAAAPESAAAPSITPGPTPTSSSGTGGPAVASASEVRQEFGP